MSVFRVMRTTIQAGRTERSSVAGSG